MQYLLGIDNGGTFVKAGLVDTQGNLVAVCREPIQNFSPKPGYTERDMDALWAQNAKVIKAKVPLSEMFGYATDLRSGTQGRASYTMQFDEYEQVPKNVADEIISKAGGNA